MAVYQNVFCKSFVAGGNLSTKQYHFVKLSAANTVVICSGATDIPIGILQNNPESGAEATVMMLGTSKLVSDAALSVGALIGTSADGQGDAKTAGTDTTEYVVGVALSASTAAGGVIEVALNTLNPHRAA